MIIGKRTILLFGSLILLVGIRAGISGFFSSVIGMNLSKEVELILTLMMVVSIILWMAVFYLLAKSSSRIIEGRRNEQVRKCPECGYRLRFISGSGWYCGSCMKYRD
jgi:hypothetical protein